MSTKELISIARDLGAQQAEIDLERFGHRRDSIDFENERRDWRAGAVQAGDDDCVTWANEVAARADSTHNKVARAYLTAYEG